MKAVPANWHVSQQWLKVVWEQMNLPARMLPAMERVVRSETTTRDYSDLRSMQITNMLENRRGKAADLFQSSPAAANAGGDGQYHFFPSPRKRSPKNDGGERRRKRKKGAVPLQVPVVNNDQQQPAGEAPGGRPAAQVGAAS